ncbi:MAG: glycine cleavage system protein GcvH [Deltaproteobacteria bacterium]|nr:glycine cleavage system protein GcvH [Deltaproteobacteria bacterium]
MEFPEDLKYTKQHEWARPADGRVTVGITDYAQDSLGELVYVELPEVGSEVSKEDTFGVVESVKAVSDLFAPVSGSVVEVNTALVESPEMLNSDPYGDGWLIVVDPSDVAELDDMMDAKEYADFVEAEKKG